MTGNPVPIQQAEAIATAAREHVDPRNVERGKNYFATPQIVQIPPPKRGVKTHFPAPQNVGYFLESREGGPLSLSVRPRPTASATS
jgi:hypothetical protein